MEISFDIHDGKHNINPFQYHLLHFMLNCDYYNTDFHKNVRKTIYRVR